MSEKFVVPNYDGATLTEPLLRSFNLIDEAIELTIEKKEDIVSSDNDADVNDNINSAFIDNVYDINTSDLKHIHDTPHASKKQTSEKLLIEMLNKCNTVMDLVIDRYNSVVLPAPSPAQLPHSASSNCTSGCTKPLPKLAQQCDCKDSFIHVNHRVDGVTSDINTLRYQVNKNNEHKNYTIDVVLTSALGICSIIGATYIITSYINKL